LIPLLGPKRLEGTGPKGIIPFPPPAAQAGQPGRA